MAIITCRNLNLSFGEDFLFREVSFNIESGDKLCITGVNGSGKSTLLRILNHEMVPEDGHLWFKDNLKVSVLQQSLPEVTEEQTVFDVVAEELSDIGDLLRRYHHLLLEAEPDQTVIARLHDQIEHHGGWSTDHRIMAVLSRLQLDPEQCAASLSGGWLRRVAIAKSLVAEPDVWILDEPTNHLDILAIEWLENVLTDFPGAVVFVSHDRQLMSRVAQSFLDIDRGRVQRFDCEYDSYLERKAQLLELEAKDNARMDAVLAREEVWIRQGIKARRTRNEGRVRALKKLREERRDRVTDSGAVKLNIDEGERTGKLVKELISVSKTYGDNVIVDDFSLILQRGDRLGIVGPNGCGKSTLLKLLLELEQPDSGQIRSGTKLQVAYFDQIRGSLNPDSSVADTISDGREYVTINQRDIHVVTYLQNFLFTPDHARSPVRILSGGEQNRLLLAKLFSLPANLLVLDEPTNDLDIQSLELLEELLLEYNGTVLLVTHDRSFLDNVVTSMLMFEGRGQVTEYIGGYSDWRESAATLPSITSPLDKEQTSADNWAEQKAARRALQKRQRELESLPIEIEAVEAVIKLLHGDIAAPGFYDQAQQDQDRKLIELKSMESKLEQLYLRWEELEESSHL